MSDQQHQQSVVASMPVQVMSQPIMNNAPSTSTANPVVVDTQSKAKPKNTGTRLQHVPDLGSYIILWLTQ